MMKEWSSKIDGFKLISLMFVPNLYRHRMDLLPALHPLDLRIFVFFFKKGRGTRIYLGGFRVAKDSRGTLTTC